MYDKKLSKLEANVEVRGYDRNAHLVMANFKSKTHLLEGNSNFFELFSPHLASKLIKC
jgi:hypothetical protein